MVSQQPRFSMSRPFIFIPALGKTFNKWTVEDDTKAMWTVRCQCGLSKSIRRDHVIDGKSKGCVKCGQIEHGHSSAKKMSRAYTIWSGARSRCNNPNGKAWKRYGGRGIVFCSRWDDFSLFLEDMGEPEPGMTLERIDNDGPYSPDNCRWATSREQMRNQSTTVFLKLGEGEFSQPAIAEALCISRKLLAARLAVGWQVKLTLEKD